MIKYKDVTCSHRFSVWSTQKKCVELISHLIAAMLERWKQSALFIFRLLSLFVTVLPPIKIRHFSVVAMASNGKCVQTFAGLSRHVKRECKLMRGARYDFISYVTCSEIYSFHMLSLSMCCDKKPVGYQMTFPKVPGFGWKRSHTECRGGSWVSACAFWKLVFSPGLRRHADYNKTVTLRSSYAPMWRPVQKHTPAALYMPLPNLYRSISTTECMVFRLFVV